MRLGIEAGSQSLEVAVQENVAAVPILAADLVEHGVQRTLAPLKERGLVACQIGAFGYNPLCVDPAQKSVLKQVIRLAAETGCPYIVICGGNYHPSGFLAGDQRNFTDAALDTIADELSPLARLAERHGARLCIEPYIKTAIYSPERFLALQARVGSPALRINVDVTSFYGYWEMWDASRTVEHVCTALAGHYGLGHLKDLALSDGFHIHVGLAPIGASVTDWATVLRLMAPNLPDDSWVILEHLTSPEEAETSLKYIRRAASEAGIPLD